MLVKLINLCFKNPLDLIVPTDHIGLTNQVQYTITANHDGNHIGSSVWPRI